MRTPATAADLKDLLGDVDELAIERILESGASLDEVAEALADIGDERHSGYRREPTTACVAEVRVILEELFDEGDALAAMPA